jgi:putative nucleotidyltransferase with HDIG domain
MAHIAKLVDRDPPLAARLVATASSVIYSRGVRVTSTQAALVRIGLATARDLLLQAAYERSTTDLTVYQAEVARSFEHSVKTAIAARLVARELRVPHEDAYLFGLLHDIGEARVYRILAKLPGAPHSRALVQDLVMRHHAQAGADVAKAWNLPAAIADVCTHHHDDVEKVSVPARIVIAAEALVRPLEGLASPADGEVRVLERLGIGAERAAALLATVAETISLARSE